MKLSITDTFETTSPTKRVFLFDPFSVIREAVAGWIEQTPDLVVCGEADDAAAALKAIRRLKPDIVVTEIIRQQDMKFILALHRQNPKLHVLVFSSGEESTYAPMALMVGADGYLRKGVDDRTLVDGIRNSLNGRVVLSDTVRYKLLQKCTRLNRPVPTWRKSPRCPQKLAVSFN